MITVRYYGKLSRKTGTGEECLEAGTLSQLLKEIKRRYGTEVYKEARRSNIVVNGENAGSRGGYALKLNSGDTVLFLPICGGG